MMSPGFGSLVGIDGVELHRRLELLPSVAIDATLPATVLPDFRVVECARAVSRVATPVRRGRKRSSQVVSTRWIERLELLAQRR